MTVGRIKLKINKGKIKLKNELNDERKDEMSCPVLSCSVLFCPFHRLWLWLELRDTILTVQVPFRFHTYVYVRIFLIFWLEDMKKYFKN